MERGGIAVTPGGQEVKVDLPQSLMSVWLTRSSEFLVDWNVRWM